MGAKTIAAIALSITMQAVAFAIHPSTARVYVTDYVGNGRMEQSIGSGILVAPGILATNWHVIEDAKGVIRTHFMNGQWGQGRVLASNRTWDIALVSTGNVQGVQPIPLGPPPKIGEQVELAGFGRQGIPISHMGRVLGYKNAQGGNQRAWFATSSPSRMGDSGGPVIDMQGRLVGNLWGTSNSETLSVRSGAIRVLLAQCSTGQCPTPQYRTVPGPTYGTPGPRYSQRQPRMPTQAYPPSQPAAPYPEPATMGPDELIGLVKPPAARAAPRVNTSPAFTIKTGLDPDLKDLFNRDDIKNEQQRLLMQVQGSRQLQQINESLSRIEALLGTKHEPKGE